MWIDSSVIDDDDLLDTEVGLDPSIEVNWDCELRLIEGPDEGNWDNDDDKNGGHNEKNWKYWTKHMSRELWMILLKATCKLKKKMVWWCDWWMYDGMGIMMKMMVIVKLICEIAEGNLRI